MLQPISNAVSQNYPMTSRQTDSKTAYKPLISDKNYHASLKYTDSYIPSSADNYSSPYTKLEASTQDTTKSSVSLPSKYASLKNIYIYYKDERISYYDLVKKGVDAGIISIDESKPIGEYTAAVTKELIYKNAAPLYSWSSTKYSEDGKYVMRVGLNGEIDGMTSTISPNGTHIKDIAAKLASGIMPCDLDEVDRAYLLQVDRELYEASVNIGQAKRNYEELSSMYHKGTLTKSQYINDCYPLYLLFFGDKSNITSDIMLDELKGFFNKDSSAFCQNALSHYNPNNIRLLSRLTQSGYQTYSGLF